MTAFGTRDPIAEGEDLSAVGARGLLDLARAYGVGDSDEYVQLEEDCIWSVELAEISSRFDSGAVIHSGQFISGSNLDPTDPAYLLAFGCDFDFGDSQGLKANYRINLAGPGWGPIKFADEDPEILEFDGDWAHFGQSTGRTNQSTLTVFTASGRMSATLSIYEIPEDETVGVDEMIGLMRAALADMP